MAKRTRKEAGAAQSADIADTTAAAASTGTPDAAPAPEGDGKVRVRMYRQGLGDCFLLSFPTDGGGRFHLLIDCGVLLGTGDAIARMTTVARDIAKATGGRLDVLVATHEHWDHLSGFVQAQEVFEKELEVGEVWLAWTENEQHPLARELRQQRKKQVEHLRAAVTSFAALGAAETAVDIQKVLDFFGDLGVAGRNVRLALDGEGTEHAGGKSTADALAYLASRKDARVTYRRPGEPAFRLPVLGDVRVYVLGPPEDRVLIRKSDPTRRGREVYEHNVALSPADSFFAALALDTPPAEGEPRVDPELTDLSFPFDRKHRLSKEQAKAFRAPGEDADGPGFFESRYGFDGAGGEAWRRVDDQWLGMATELALALDGDTNNTSLALAFELGEGGPVLLFPADAQVGNWLSWDGHGWPKDEKRPDAGTVTAEDLLRRTVLYKVGHHGSHNATLREKGLERMASPDLVALVPVDQAMAAKKRWAMPFGPLYERLKEKTRGRVLRVDLGRLPKEEAALYGLTEREWDEWEKRTPEEAERTLDGKPLWIEVHV
jgi:hypothetical protein